MKLRLVRSAVLAVLLAAASSGCANVTWHAGPAAPAHQQEKLITLSEIRQSGATNAWEALERSGTRMSGFETAARPAPRTEPRERGGLLRSLPKVIVDGVQVLEVRLLRDIPAHLISSIRILSGVGAEPSAEPDEHNEELILIRTRNSPGG